MQPLLQALITHGMKKSSYGNGQTMFKTPKSFQTANIMTTSSQCQSADDVLYVPNHKHPTVCIILGKTNLLPNKNKNRKNQGHEPNTVVLFSSYCLYVRGRERDPNKHIYTLQSLLVRPMNIVVLVLVLTICMCMQSIPIPREIEKGQLELGQEKLLAPVFNQSIL